MNNLHAKRHNDYVVVDFDNVTERGLKKLTDQLNKSGAKVSSVEANNRKSRKDGLFVKRAKLNFENGQAITLSIGDQGDIYQMTLNGAKQPVPDAKNERDLAKNLSNTLEKNQKKFDKSLFKKMKKPKPTGTKPLRQTLTTRAAASAERIQQLEQNKEQLNTSLGERTDALTEQQSQIEQLNSTLQSEYQESRELEKQLEQAKIDAGVTSNE